MQGYFPIKGGSRSVRFGSGSIVHHNEHVGITQFHTIDNGILFLQVYAMAFKEETSQYTTYTDTLYQIGRVQENSVHGYLIHFYLSAYQRPCLHAHVQAFQGQQSIRSLFHGKRVTGSRGYLFICLYRLDDLHTTYQQVQRKAEVNTFNRYIHTCCLGCDGGSLLPYQVLYGRDIKQYHQYCK